MFLTRPERSDMPIPSTSIPLLTATTSSRNSNQQSDNRNLNPNLVVALQEAHGSTPSPEEIFHYSYAILQAPIYREKYAEFLRSDFPRIPFTANRELFAHLAAFGKRLTDLHLLTSPELDLPVCRPGGEGDEVVVRTKAQGFHYDPDECRIYVNRTQYFGLSPQMFMNTVSACYQVCDKCVERSQGPLPLTRRNSHLLPNSNGHWNHACHPRTARYFVS